MTAWLALGLMVGSWLLPAVFFFLRFQARRYKLSAVIACFPVAIIILGANALGFIPPGYGFVVAGVTVFLGLFIDLAILQDIRNNRRLLAKPPDDT